MKQRLKGIGDLPLHADGEIIERVHTFKYLGLTLDDSLNFEDHVDISYRKTFAKLGAIKKARACMRLELLVLHVPRPVFTRDIQPVSPQLRACCTSLT